MQQHQKKITGLIAAIICILSLSLFFWLRPDVTQDIPTATPTSTQDNATSTEATSAMDANSAHSLVSNSQKDTQINCQIRTDASNRLIVNEQTKDCFEYFITQYGEKTIEQIKADFLTYTKESYKDPVMSQISDLWTRYMQYREQLGNLQVPTADKESAKYYQQIVNNTQNLRKKFFSDYEIQGLFGTQDTYDQYTVDRMQILEDKTLSAIEKANKLQALFEKLPEDWKENLKQLNQLEDLRKLTAEIKARGGSADELRQMRTNLVGPEATQRLETLDVQRNDWKGKVTQYLAERDNIMKSNMSDSAKQSAVNQLKLQQFSNQQEQIRLQTFETIYDQGGNLPFAN